MCNQAISLVTPTLRDATVTIPRFECAARIVATCLEVTSPDGTANVRGGEPRIAIDFHGAECEGVELRLTGPPLHHRRRQLADLAGQDIRRKPAVSAVRPP